MIAQPLVTTAPTAKPATAPQAQAQAQQAQQPNANGFLSVLTATDASLAQLAQTASTSATAAPAAANNNKPKTADPSGTPYVAAPTTATPATTPTPKDAGQGSANAAAGDVVPAASDAAQSVAANADTNSSSGSGNSTGFGADQLNARIAAGAPLYASQPSPTMATVPTHLLDAATPHSDTPSPAGKNPGDAATKPDSDTAPDLPAASNASPGAPSLPSPAGHALAAQPDAVVDKSSAAAGDTPSIANAGDASTTSASLAAQPEAAPSLPAQADAAVHTATPYVPVGEQVALNLRQAVAADNNEIRIQLKPASLGTIDVKLNVTQDGRISAVISADRSDTLNMLKQDSGTLQQALRDAGLQADSGSLSFNLRGDAQSFAQSWSQGGGGNGAVSAYGGTGNDDIGPSVANTGLPAPRYHAGALDIEV